MTNDKLQKKFKERFPSSLDLPNTSYFFFFFLISKLIQILKKGYTCKLIDVNEKGKLYISQNTIFYYASHVLKKATKFSFSIKDIKDLSFNKQKTAIKMVTNEKTVKKIILQFLYY